MSKNKKKRKKQKGRSAQVDRTGVETWSLVRSRDGTILMTWMVPAGTGLSFIEYPWWGEEETEWWVTRTVRADAPPSKSKVHTISDPVLSNLKEHMIWNQSTPWVEPELANGWENDSGDAG